MYRRAITALLLGNAVLAAGAFQMSDLDGELLKEASAETSAVKYEIERQLEVEDASRMEIVYSRASQNRKIIYDLLEETAEIEEGVSVQEETTEYVYDLSERDMELLLRIVEAEAGCEDEDGRILVANVVLNRMESELFGRGGIADKQWCEPVFPGILREHLDGRNQRGNPGSSRKGLGGREYISGSVVLCCKKICRQQKNEMV